MLAFAAEGKWGAIDGSHECFVYVAVLWRCHYWCVYTEDRIRVRLICYYLVFS